MDSNSLLIDSSNSVCSLPSYNLLGQALGYHFRIRNKNIAPNVPGSILT